MPRNGVLITPPLAGKGLTETRIRLTGSLGWAWRWRQTRSRGHQYHSLVVPVTPPPALTRSRTLRLARVLTACRGAKPTDHPSVGLLLGSDNLVTVLGTSMLVDGIQAAEVRVHCLKALDAVSNRAQGPTGPAGWKHY